MTTPTELDAALEPRLVFQFHIAKPKEESLSYHIAVDTPPIVRTFHNQHEQELLRILKYVQTLALVNACQALDIYLLPEAVVTYYFCKTEHEFKAEDLDLSHTLSKELRSPFVNWLKELRWMAEQADELMACMICGRHLDVKPLTSEDIEKKQGMPGGFEAMSSKGKECLYITPQRGEGSKRQQRFRQQPEGGDLVAKEPQYEADEQGSDHQEDETTATTPAPPGLTGHSSSEESNSE